MNYKKLFHQAFSFTIHNPLLWVFGLALSGGFNLALVNFAALVPGAEWKNWPAQMDLFSGVEPFHIVILSTGFVISFLILNLIKVGFTIQVHNLVHTKETVSGGSNGLVERLEFKTSAICSLCIKIENKTTPFYFFWLRVMTASLITIFITITIGILVNSLINQAGPHSPAALILNFLFLVGVTIVLGTWNTFCGYFVILHDLNFRAAAKAAIDMLVLKFVQVVVFVTISSIIYTISVFVGNAFINAWQHGFEQVAVQNIRGVFLIIFLLWLAVNNTFFNISFFLFFNKLVKPAKDDSFSKERYVLPHAP